MFLNFVFTVTVTPQKLFAMPTLIKAAVLDMVHPCVYSGYANLFAAVLRQINQKLQPHPALTLITG